ncbi:theobromine synthase 2-like [Senna tora]|uniref:Theobromine synthase 2-like n=1 Tax=Senna tora TaxID=362788 RepID=A0A834SX58_9FABA|nr:theobromine synthase 2-like [Senna tora]
MATEEVLHMNGGVGETSYANNSLLQKSVNESEANPEREHHKTYEIIAIIDALSLRLKKKTHAFQLFLNDLPSNDFNTIFKSLLPDFYKKLHQGHNFGHNCFIAGVPGSFYKRSEDQESLTFPTSIIGMALHDMVLENKAEEAKLDSYDTPHYGPSEKEVRKIIEEEGSFTLEKLEISKLGWDGGMNEEGDDTIIVHGKLMRAKFIANYTRAVNEPLLKSHFGDAIMDELFLRVSDKLVQLMEEKKELVFTNLVLSITKN